VDKGGKTPVAAVTLNFAAETFCERRRNLESGAGNGGNTGFGAPDKRFDSRVRQQSGRDPIRAAGMLP
jgi:hypothetical protein